MKLPVVISGLVVSLALVGCSDQTEPASSSEKSMAPATVAPSIAYEDMPEVDEASVTLECATFSEGAVPFVRQEADLMVNDVQYRVATVACGAIASEVSAEVVESFVADNGVWASNGLVSGPDVPFNTSGPCESDNKVVKCPAFVVSEEGEAVGYIEITGQDNGLVWTFIAEEEVAL
ncbi:MAG: hypothetical protein NT097_03740 [Actinobacteria bacterium]|nr:hypothetical protein [Actinomycetota bacterium]